MMRTESCGEGFGAVITLALAALAIYLVYKLACVVLPYVLGGLGVLLAICVAWIIPDFIIHSFCHSMVWLYVFGIAVYIIKGIFVTFIMLTALYSIGETDKFPYPGVFRTVLGIVFSIAAELIAIVFCSSLIRDCQLYNGALSVVLMIVLAAASIITALLKRRDDMDLWWNEVRKKDDSIDIFD